MSWISQDPGSQKHYVWKVHVPVGDWIVTGAWIQTQAQTNKILSLSGPISYFGEWWKQQYNHTQWMSISSSWKHAFFAGDKLKEIWLDSLIPTEEELRTFVKNNPKFFLSTQALAWYGISTSWRRVDIFQEHISVSFWTKNDKGKYSVTHIDHNDVIKSEVPQNPEEEFHWIMYIDVK